MSEMGTGVFVPDVLTAAQFFSERKSSAAEEGIQRLMLAVMEDALRCLGENATALSNRNLSHSSFTFRKQHMAREAAAWFLVPGGEGPFSFENVCEVLGGDPDAVRKRIAEMLETEVPKLARKRAPRSPVLGHGMRVRLPRSRSSQRVA